MDTANLVKHWLGEPIPGTDLILAKLVGRRDDVLSFRARSQTIERDFFARLYPNSSRAERWEPEVKALQALDNPHVPKLFHTVETNDHVVVITQWLDGIDLASWLDGEGGTVGVSDAISIVQQLAQAVAELHERGFVHLRVHPGNILIERVGTGAPFVRLIGFHATRRFDEPRARVDEAVVAEFTAPEQITGAPIDARTDIYQLGCLLHYLLTGRAPFVAENREKTLEAHLSWPAPRLSDTFAHLAGTPLNLLAAKMLDRDPAGRPADCEAVVSALDEAARVERSEGEISQAESDDDDRPSMLIIEDDEHQAKFLGELVAPRYRATIARTALSGIFHAADQPPAVIVLDLSMPGVGGWDILQVLRADDRTNAIPVVIAADGVCERDEAQARQMGCGFVQKPFELHQLYTEISRALGATAA